MEGGPVVIRPETAGHIAFSAARVGGVRSGWLLLGPVAVRPDRQREGISSALVSEVSARRIQIA